MKQATAVSGALAITGAAVAAQEEPDPQKPSRAPTERVKLGKTGITASLLGIGTGSTGWNHQSNQTRLGQERFTAMIRHALDRGITFFDAADMYGSHTFLREALKGVPREKYVLQSKIIHRTAEEARADLDRFRRELGVDYIDIVLMHVVTEADWNVRYRGVREALEEAKQKKIIRAHGCSCHSFAALQTAAADPWVDVDLARFNPWGAHMDQKPGDPPSKTPEQVRETLLRMRRAGKGVIGMKILANGDAVRGEDRLARARESIKFALASSALDMMIIGFESPRQIDEVFEETRIALEELAHRAV
jgi:aryl-alcohol dehydrogenase-like predicted oxidoreductase